MKCSFLILNKVECLDDLLLELGNYGIHGATILSSEGMGRRLLKEDDDTLRFIGSLRQLLDPDREESKMLICVLKDEQVPFFKQAVIDIVGDLREPDTGIMFTLPVDMIYGGSFE